MLVFGIDIGGSSIKGGVVRDTGEVLDHFMVEMDKYADPHDSIQILNEFLVDWLNTHQYDEEICGIGIGCPGILDKDTGVVAYSPNLPKWLNFNIKEFVENYTHLQVKVINDASAAVLGEAKFGSGKDYKNFIMITLGTGVGCGIIANGQLYDGNGGTGAQLGHTVIEVNGRDCTCGRRGCIEAYASATALIKETKKAMESHPDSLLNKVANELGKVSARVPFMAEKQGDEVAHQIIEEYIKYLSEALLNICNVFRPSAIAISGGVANEGQPFIDRIRKYIKDRNYGYTGSPVVEIKKAELGYDSGKIGAASLLFE